MEGLADDYATRWGSVKRNRVVGLADMYALDGVVWREIGWWVYQIFMTLDGVVCRDIGCWV